MRDGSSRSEVSTLFLYQLRILAALQLKKPGEVYAGTVSFKEKARRRAAGKRAKAARRANR